MRRFPHYLPLKQYSEDSSGAMSTLTRTYLVIIIIGFSVVLSLLYYVSSHMMTPQHRREHLHNTPGLLRKHTGGQHTLFEEPGHSNATDKSSTSKDDTQSHMIRILEEETDKISYNTTPYYLQQTTTKTVPKGGNIKKEDRPVTVKETGKDEVKEIKKDEAAIQMNERGVEDVEKQCRPHQASKTIVNTHPKFRKDIPLFVTNDYKSYSSVMNYPPPFGLKETDKFLTSVLKVLPQASTMPDNIERIQCKRCMVVGSGGILEGKKLGAQIDDFDIVIRMNNAPVQGFQEDVGHKTTIRMSYPEGALQDPKGYDPDSLFLMVPFKSLDFLWLQRIIGKQSLRDISSKFWKSIAHVVPKNADKFRIVNPALLQETSFDLIGFPTKGGKMGKNVPTMGSLGIIWAINYCDEVSVAGFGYDLSKPSVWLHYYKDVKMSTIANSWTHDINKEKDFLKTLVRNGVITDLTGGILGGI
ncbi:PREDICTED: CMP-N-acetylneuraminate-beta-1,4-galactoside alpha-2,3-sialyltransferase-like [Branchiostoma belcheri]|uniref:Lactosylceramide alpha-2,3-sialyltransferase n=1 Tax=Branchiostoma belcheri TaxID=7741 RepID=A0A6P4XWX1_BRABE|nr:PREDICTED: CMP-N-acetylneuraminate-beta-1,4-galactoside alpha-2,3-sialyltransferase-like [Branchiostoma belcheri]